MDYKGFKMVNDENGNSVYFPNPAKDETKMGLWNGLFGQEVADIMRANYLSHAKNGYKGADGVKVRNIRDFDGTVIKTMDLKDDDEKPAKSSTPTVDNSAILKGAIKTVNLLISQNNPALKEAIDTTKAIVDQLIPPAFLQMDIETLEYLLAVKKAEAVEAVVEEKK
jgi:hypothetical protein